jgi:hypothetical protein
MYVRLNDRRQQIATVIAIVATSLHRVAHVFKREPNLIRRHHSLEEMHGAGRASQRTGLLSELQRGRIGKSRLCSQQECAILAEFLGALRQHRAQPNRAHLSP